MRLGLFMMPVHPPGRVLADTLAEDEETALYADRLGFDELWLGEHFSATTEPIPSPLMFMAGLVPRTKNLTFGTAVICLPNHHPVKVAAEVAQFDHMSRGRFMLGIGFMPKPYRTGGPPISMSVSSRNSPTARVAAQRGWGIISANNVPRPALPAHWETYSKACADAGKQARGENWRVARNVMVAASEAEARDRVFGEHGSNRYFYTYMREVLSRVGLLGSLKPHAEMADEEATVDVIIEGSVLYGSAKTFLDKLVALRDEAGPFGTLLMTGLDWSGPNRAWERESMRLLAQEVMSKFRQHVAAKAAE